MPRLNNSKKKAKVRPVREESPDDFSSKRVSILQARAEHKTRELIRNHHPENGQILEVLEVGRDLIKALLPSQLSFDRSEGETSLLDDEPVLGGDNISDEIGRLALRLRERLPSCRDADDLEEAELFLKQMQKAVSQKRRDLPSPAGSVVEKKPIKSKTQIPERREKREYYREQLTGLAGPRFLAGVKEEMERINREVECMKKEMECFKEEMKRIAREKEKTLEQFGEQIDNEVKTIQPVAKGLPGFAESLAKCCIVMELFSQLPSVQHAVKQFVNANLRENQSPVQNGTEINSTVTMSEGLPVYEFYWTQDHKPDRVRIPFTRFLSRSRSNSL